jgi:nucleoporin NUP82
MLAVYETVDLGIVSLLSTEPSSLELIRGNYPVIYPDPIHDNTVYVYHAFGVHSINLEQILSSLAEMIRLDDGTGTLLLKALEQPVHAYVQPIVTTFSVEQRCFSITWPFTNAVC